MQGLLNRFINTLVSRQDILIVVFLALILLMIIIPLPTWLVDMMITLNFMVAILILMVGLYLKSASDFTTLPAIILITTLFRLAISISTTRLILLDADAGQIVNTFGQFVVGGSLIVGIIIFLIITIVQFVVITKGAERVAEVGARFSLDAMPGKQMAIDSDLRTGELDLSGARTSRNKIQTESQFYGAMDGTMKFVKGDSIAGIVIILVNIIGGMAVGISQDGLSVSEAASLYTILTVGDGLVSQIPALIIAISAGSVVTRVSGEKGTDLGSEIAQQLGASQDSLRYTSILLVAFALIPGFPKVPFIVAGALIFGASLLAARRTRNQQELDVLNKEIQDEESAQASPVKIIVAQPLFDRINRDAFRRAVGVERKILFTTIGVKFPDFALMEGDLGDDEVHITFFGVGVLKKTIVPDAYVVLDRVEALTTIEIPHSEPMELWENGGSANWIKAEYLDKLTQHGIEHLSLEEAIARAVSLRLTKHCEFFLGVQETKLLLNKANRQYPDLVEETLEAVKLVGISEVLQNLVRENNSIRDMRSVLEALVRWGTKENDPEVLTEYVRSALAKQISASVSQDLNTIYSYVLSPELEDVIRNSVRVTEVGTYLSLPSEARDSLLGQVREIYLSKQVLEGTPVLVTSMDIRRVIRSLLWTNAVEIPILSQQDIAPDYRVQILGELTA